MLVNRIRQILRRPSRLFVWAIFVLWFGSFVFMRSHGGPSDFQSIFPRQLRFLYAFVPAGYLIILGAQIVIGCSRPPATFAYPADARFLFGSRLPQRFVVFWLQLREAFFSGSRMVFVLFVSAWWFAHSAGGLLSAGIALADVYIIAFALRLPAFLINRRFPQSLVPWWGYALIATGAGALAYPFSLALGLHDFHLKFLATHMPQFPPGTWLIAALNGHLLALLWLTALAAGVVAIGSFTASDAYPELWEASARLYAFRSLAATGRLLWNREAWRKLRDTDPARRSSQPVSAVSVSGERTPRGAFTILWKDWLALARSPGGVRWPVFWMLGGVIAGYGLAIVAMDTSVLILVSLLLPALNTILVLGSQASVTLSNEIRRPIWWLAQSELRDRLLMWAAAGLMRVGPPLIVTALVAGIAMHSWLLVASAVPLTLALLMLIRAIGLACYVFLPGRNDLRGPGFILRFLATYVLLIPPAAVWMLLESVTHSLAAGAFGGLFFAGAEIYALVFLAALRLEENGMAYAAAEER